MPEPEPGWPESYSGCQSGLQVASSVLLLPWETPRTLGKSAEAGTVAGPSIPYATRVHMLCTGVRVQGHAQGQIAVVQICTAAICPVGNMHPFTYMLMGMHPL